MKSRLANNLSLKIMAVLFAVILWLIVVNIDDPVTEQTFREIPVSVLHDEIVTNKGSTYQITNNSSKASVTVKAKRSLLDKVTKEDIIATADMREMYASSNEAGQIAIDVSINGLAETEYDAVSSPRNVQIRIEDNASKTFPITVSTMGTTRDGYVLGELQTDPEKILVSGPSSLVNRIERVEAKVSVSGLSEDSTIPAELLMFDGNGDEIDQMLLKNNLGKEGVSVDVQILNSKTVDVEIDDSRIKPAEGYSISSITYEPKNIVVVGKKEDLEEIEKISVPSSAIELSDVSEKKEFVVDLTKYLPEEVTLHDENAGSIAVTVAVEKEGTKAFLVPAATVAVRNAPVGYKVEFLNVEDITVEIDGPEEVLEAFKIEEKLFINLENMKEAGTYSVPLEAELPEGCKFVQTITVPVELKKQ